MDDGKLCLRAVRVLQVDKERLVVISSVPLDHALLSKVANQVGVISLRPFATGKNQSSSGPSDQVIDFGPNPHRFAEQNVSGGNLPAPEYLFDREVNFPATASLLDWDTGNDPAVCSFL